MTDDLTALQARIVQWRDQANAARIRAIKRDRWDNADAVDAEARAYNAVLEALQPFIERAHAQEQEPSIEQVTAALVRLLKHLAPQCEPLPDVLGVCSQLDNYIAGQQERVETLTRQLHGRED